MYAFIVVEHIGDQSTPTFRGAYTDPRNAFSARQAIFAARDVSSDKYALTHSIEIHVCRLNGTVEELMEEDPGDVPVTLEEWLMAGGDISSPDIITTVFGALEAIQFAEHRRTYDEYDHLHGEAMKLVHNALKKVKEDTS